MPYLVLIFIVSTIILAWLLAKTRKESSLLVGHEQEKQRSVIETISKLQQLLTSINNKSLNEKEWYSEICLLFQDHFNADGCLIIRAVSNDRQNSQYKLLISSGCCDSWFPEEEGENPIFESDIRQQFFWSSDSHLLTDEHLSECLPDNKKDIFSSAMTGEFKILNQDAFLVLLRKKEFPHYTMDELHDFETCFQIVRGGFKIINFYNDNEKLKESLDNAHEEGMIQISTGIIHNIGNGMAVLKMALEHFEDFKSIIELSTFLQAEILPALDKDIKSLKLNSDDKLAKYVEAIKEIIVNVKKVAEHHETDLQEVNDKFQNIIDIISLQQQFIGELGTENVVSIESITQDVVKMCEQPLEQNSIELKQKISTKAEILVDPALFRQVLLVICKYSMKSINAVRRSKPLLELNISDKEITEKDSDGEKITTKFVHIDINNNGYGIDFDPEAVLTTESKDTQQHRELLFCKNKVEKYGGTFLIESSKGHGANVLIDIPVNEK